MNNKKLNTYLRKELRQIGHDYKREKARCARLYPDWRDDEFNMLDNLFIWGYNTDAKIIPSFYSWDDAYIYFNRKTKKYYMTIDTGFYDRIYDEEVARAESERLDRIENAFRNFLIENQLPTTTLIFPFQDPALEAESLSELYVKYKIMIEGYRMYRLSVI